MESSELYNATGSRLPEHDVLCYTAFMRAGKTKTTSFSLDEETRLNLKALADRHHGGNVSALLAEFASREKKLVAAEAYFKKYNVPPLTEAASARIDDEWCGEGMRARKRTKSP
jgi:hypothetical protein